MIDVKVSIVKEQPKIPPRFQRKVSFLTHELTCEEVTDFSMPVAIPMLIIHNGYFFQAVTDACSIMEMDGYKTATLYVMNNPCRFGFAAVKD
jgi:hypothetical protein